MDLEKEVFPEWKDDLGITTQFGILNENLKKQVIENHKVPFCSQIEYKNRSYLFLYEPELYASSQPASLQANQLRR